MSDHLNGGTNGPQDIFGPGETPPEILIAFGTTVSRLYFVEQAKSFYRQQHDNIALNGLKSSDSLTLELLNKIRNSNGDWDHYVRLFDSTEQELRKQLKIIYAGCFWEQRKSYTTILNGEYSNLVLSRGKTDHIAGKAPNKFTQQNFLNEKTNDAKKAGTESDSGNITIEAYVGEMVDVSVKVSEQINLMLGFISDVKKERRDENRLGIAKWGIGLTVCGLALAILFFFLEHKNYIDVFKTEPNSSNSSETQCSKVNNPDC